MDKSLLEPIFLQPVFKERIWGGTKLKTMFGYDIPSSKTGECWAISAHPNGQSIVKNGAFQGMILGDLYQAHRELFGYLKDEKFPLLIKILDANDDLSVQVHPNDQYANVHENGEFGKTECWYVIDCPQDAKLIYGHHAKNKQELIEMIERKEWNKFLRKIPIHSGDFIYVPSGTVHALTKGTVVIEIQQSSDTTYRIYDYDRRDDKGRLRELHLDKAIDVITVPHQDPVFQPKEIEEDAIKITTFISNQIFTVEKWEVQREARKTQNQSFMLFSVLKGNGYISKGEKNYPFTKGDHFILPYQFGEYEIRGEVELIVSY
ncbi:mannose-6-phosphate isomerase, class I [Tepidibacillus sp. LV47]|uniref:mannose-6-phosphate isomerase, class I n=1 Tax=Tepidibacillus sp. LV47 TaxID=3398228 RepID=UPI003AAD4CAB